MEGGSSIIHFYDKKNPRCTEIDAQFEELAKKYTACMFLWINGALTHFVSARLKISKFPTILAMRNNIVLDRLSDDKDLNSFTVEGEESFLRAWVERTVPLLSLD